ncbi:MAG: helix-turn-helix domain-containing protein [Bacteroidales bacterium]|nr:helix-turn-helix domain-containing protein [Bacteroidales bacterium]
MENDVKNVCSLLEKILVEMQDLKEHGGCFADLLERVDRLEKKDTIFSMQEAAKYCGRTRQTLRKWADIGKIHIVERGCRHGILKSELDRVRRI